MSKRKNHAELRQEKQAALSQESLRSILDYNPETGLFTWKERRASTAPAGSVAGTKRVSRQIRKGVTYESPRIAIKIEGKVYDGHRLAWFYVHGVWPEHKITHANDNGFDNRISNLIEKTDKQLVLSNPRRRSNTSGYIGVSWQKKTRRWVAYIGTKETRTIYLGLFDTKEEAYMAYRKAAIDLYGPDFVDKAGPLAA